MAEEPVLVDRDEEFIDHGTYSDMTLEDEAECADDQGGTFLVRPNRAGKARDQPGQQTAATRGSIANSRSIPNGEKGGRVK